SVAIVGLGWLGLPLALHLKELGWCVKGSKQSPDDAQKLHQLGIETYPFSLSDEMKRLPHHIRPLFNVDALIITLPPSSFSSQQYCEYLAFLANQAKKQGVQHVLFTSSTSVFPDISGQFDEGSQLSAETEMGKTLIQAEQCLFQSGISHCDILRLAGLIGKQRHPVKFLAGKHNLKQGYSPVNLVHLEDCIEAITTLLMNPNGLRTYHLCAPVHPTRAEYYTKAAACYDLFTPQFECSDSDPKRIIMADKICRDLGFTYRYPNPDDMLEKCSDF
ncbi:MAG: SDR family NAD(P)-dependent oxidoreductase, partial [Haemophilus parainfluenzae]|nr:SDR family NAD(P)-dependent oxidoreductase [Haemophilus parainfluenzae]